MVNGGRPPLPPRQRCSDLGMTPDTGEGGPKLPIPAIQVEVGRGRRWFLRRTESWPTFARPSTTPGQPSLVLPPLPANLRSSFHDSRPTVTRPSTTPGQPSLVLPPLQANRRSDHTYSDLRDTYVRWGSRGRPPRRNSQKNSGGAGGGQPPAGGLGAKPPRPTESVDRHSSKDFRSRSACGRRESRFAGFLPRTCVGGRRGRAARLDRMLPVYVLVP